VKKVATPATQTMAPLSKPAAQATDAKKKADVIGEPLPLASETRNGPDAAANRVAATPKTETIAANKMPGTTVNEIKTPQASPNPLAKTTVEAPLQPNEEPSSEIASPSDPTLEGLWRQTLEEVGGMTADFASEFQSISAIGPNLIKIVLRELYSVQMCNRPERRQQFEAVFGGLLNRSIAIQFESNSSRTDAAQTMPAPSRREKIRQLEKHPFVKSATQTFAAEVTDYAEPTKTFKAK
jgi:hypothetical protein